MIPLDPAIGEVILKMCDVRAFGIIQPLIEGVRSACAEGAL